MKYWFFLSVAILLLGTGGIHAYLTATSTETNVFTIGAGISGKISLSETKFDANKAKNLVPGQTVEKNPSITNSSDHNVYVFFEVTEPTMIGNDGSTVNMFSYTVDSSNFRIISQTKGNGTTNSVTVYAYATSANDMTKLKPKSSATLFDSVTLYNFDNNVSTSNTKTILGSTQNVTVKTYAIQADSDDIDGKTPSQIWSIVKSAS
jgi:predicted ribosomally synthesized peptide with SipW-like signal peptide